MGTGRHVELRDLAERIRAIERRGDAAAAAHDQMDPPAQECTPTGWAAVDAVLGGGLAAGGLHEWFGVEEAVLKQGIKGIRDLGIKGQVRSLSVPRSVCEKAQDRAREPFHEKGFPRLGVRERILAPGLEGILAPGSHTPSRPSALSSRQWAPPLCILVHLAWQATHDDPTQRWTIWIGRRCHPYPRVLIRSRGEDHRLLERSLFVAPRDAAARLWAVELALRSPAVGVVIADGSGFDRAATQRIQMLARTQMKWVLAACPPRQQHELSAAQTRWRVRIEGFPPRADPPVAERDLGIEGLRGESTSSQSLNPRWSVELLRCKGMRPTSGHRVWLLEWNRVEGAVNLSTGLADLAGAPEQRVRRAEPARIQQRTA